MKRDGACTSLWQNTSEEFTSNFEMYKGQSVDVLVVGGGITGVTTALLLQKSGFKCILAEAQSLCYGTTGGTTAHINTFFDTTYADINKKFGEDDAQLVLKAASEARNLFSQHIKEYNIKCEFSPKDAFLYSQNAEQTKELDSILEASKKAGCDVDYINSIPVPFDFQKAIVYRNQAQFHPTRYVTTLAKEFQNIGGIILEKCRVHSYKQNQLIEINTDKGIIKAANIVFATHIPPGINLLHFRCAPYRSYAMSVTLKDDKYPDGLAYDMYDPYHYYRTQEIDGKKYLIVGGFDHKTAHEPNTNKCFAELEAHIRKHFKTDEIKYKWSSQYFEPADGLAYIGHLPGNPNNIYVATGFGGNGMTYSHISALLLTDLIKNGRSDYMELFDPNRIKMVSGFSNFVKENADVVKQFIGMRLSEQKLSGLSELAKDEAKVVKYEGQSVAIYKDGQGIVHAINPVCTHAKCIVAWNTAEKSWDCPCHGARYNADGEVITGPASEGLEKVELNNEETV